MKVLLLTGLLLLNSNVFAKAGQDKGNGGFLYSRTSKKLLDDSQTQLLTDLSRMQKKRVTPTYSSPACDRPVDLKELGKAIGELTYSYQSVAVAVNPEGDEEKKYFQINDESKVEATELYFASFIDTYFRYTEEEDTYKKLLIIAPVKKAIIHESLHLFGYNELESRVCAEELAPLISSFKCDRLNDAKNLAVYIINQDLKGQPSVSGTKKKFTAKEIFEDYEIKTPNDLINGLFVGKEFTKSRSKMINPGMILNIIKYDVSNNLLKKGETFNSLYSEMKCDL